MPAMVLLDKPFATLWYYPEERMFHHVLKPGATGELFKEVLTVSMLRMENDKKEGVGYKYCSDDRGGMVLAAEDFAWSDNVFRNRALAAGWRYWALVMPENPRSRMVIERLVRQNKELGLVVEAFEDEQKALAWLRSC